MQRAHGKREDATGDGAAYYFGIMRGVEMSADCAG
jgi:hypothetical protein